MNTTWDRMVTEGRIGRWRLVHHHRCSSTNDIALSWTPADQALVVVADAQDRGRGRHGRSWSADPGAGLLFSLLVPPDLQPEAGHLPLTSLVAGLAVARAVEVWVPGHQAMLKWPNDVLVAGRKVAGILVEGAVQGGVTRLVVGVGINLRDSAWRGPLARRAGSLAGLGTGPVDRGAVLAAVVAAIEEGLTRLRRHGPETLIGEFRRRDGCAGKILSWVGADGRPVTGTGVGLDDQGRYLVRDTSGNLVPVLSGDLQLASPP